jgi:hypothetical protein
MEITLSVSPWLMQGAAVADWRPGGGDGEGDGKGRAVGAYRCFFCSRLPGWDGMEWKDGEKMMTTSLPYWAAGEGYTMQGIGRAEGLICIVHMQGGASDGPKRRMYFHHDERR